MYPLLVFFFFCGTSQFVIPCLKVNMVPLLRLIFFIGNQSDPSSNIVMRRFWLFSRQFTLHFRSVNLVFQNNHSYTRRYTRKYFFPNNFLPFCGIRLKKCFIKAENSHKIFCTGDIIYSFLFRVN